MYSAVHLRETTSRERHRPAEFDFAFENLTSQLLSSGTRLGRWLSRTSIFSKTPLHAGETDRTIDKLIYAKFKNRLKRIPQHCFRFIFCS